MKRTFLAALSTLAFAGSVHADTVTPISQSAFSGNETLITFSNATDNKSGNPITVGGVVFTNLSSGDLHSGHYFGFDRGIYLGDTPNDGQLIDVAGQTNLTIEFSDAVNRIGMELATGGSLGNTVEWSYEAFDAGNNLLGTGSVAGTIQNLKNGTTIPNDFFATGSVFLGFESTVGITKVRLFQNTNDANITIMDNLRFEAVNPAPVPLPAAAWGGMALMGLLGVNRLRKGRKLDA